VLRSGLGKWKKIPDDFLMFITDPKTIFSMKDKSQRERSEILNLDPRSKSSGTRFAQPLLSTIYSTFMCDPMNPN